jgi:hypothetical protein
MSRESAPAVNVDKATAHLYSELQRRLGSEAEDGMVDLKAMCSTDRDSTTLNKLWALNNVLRLAAAKKHKIRIIKAAAQ